MFEKLLAQLPYNPSLVHQMGFYGRRMREEAAIRRTGMVFIVLAFMVQFFAVIAPPVTSSAATGPNNNLLQNGFTSAADAANKCDSNSQDYKTILAAFDVTCNDVAHASTIGSFDPNSHDRQLFSMGRFSYPSLAGNQPINISGSTRYGSTYYVRYLWAWGSGDYKALQVKADNGTTYWLLYGCGNLVSVGVPVTFKVPGVLSVPTPPSLQLQKTTLAGYPVADSNVAPGTALGYRIYINNPSSTDASNVTLNDTLPTGTDFVSQSLNAGAKVHTFNSSSRTAQWQWGTIPKDESGSYSVDLVVKVDPSATNGERVCNSASVSGSDITVVSSNQVCMTVVVNAPPPTPSPPPTPTPPPATPSCLYDTSLSATSPLCKPCQSSTTTTDILSCVAVSKSATNMTQNLSDANNTTANPGDVIMYTLSAKNDANTTVSQYVFQENLGDVMTYADPTDLHGGSLDSSTGMVTWPAINIAAGATATEQITVKVKDPVPSLAPNTADPAQTDLTMTNVYGNVVNIHVPTPPAQSVVTASANLPNTGPGTGLFIFAVIMVVGSYFYSRSRLLARESALAVKAASVG